MFENISITTIEKVVNDLFKIVQEKSISASRQALYSYSMAAQREDKVLFDMIISYAIQSTLHNDIISRYNTRPLTQESLVEVQQLYFSYDSRRFKKLPNTAQRLLWLCSSTSVYRDSIAKLRRLITEYHPVEFPKTVQSQCKRCYSDSENTLCASCIKKIESCVEFTSDSFSSTGTTMEPFEYYFKDWEVTVNNQGEYKFKKLNKSLQRYQPNLPIKEFQNLMVLIG